MQTPRTEGQDARFFDFMTFFIKISVFYNCETETVRLCTLTCGLLHSVCRLSRARTYCHQAHDCSDPGRLEHE